MVYMNKCIIGGVITADIELKANRIGNSYCFFTVAVNQKVANKETGQITEKATFIPVSAFGKTAEFICRNGGKGCNVLIEGKISIEEYTDQNGAKQKNTKIIVDNLQLITWKQEQQQPQNQQRQVYQSAQSIDNNYPNVHKYPASMSPAYPAQQSAQQAYQDYADELPPF